MAQRFPLFKSLLVAALFFAAPVYADPLSDNPDDVKRINEYLTSLTTVTADFSQVAPDGSLTGGKFFLKRPGKMRWQYAPPTPILMIANDHELVYYDYDLDQVSHIPIESTLAGFLAREKIDLSEKTVKVESFTKASGVIRVTILQADKPESGKLTLEFADLPLTLKNMVVVDSQGQTTTVALNNAKYGEKLDNKLFVFNEKRKRTSRH